SLQHLVQSILRFVAGDAQTLKQSSRQLVLRAAADAAAAQQVDCQARQVRVRGVGAGVGGIVLEAQGGRQFFRHVPATHQPSADLFAGDAQQVLFDVARGQVRIDFQMPADQREMRREDVCQHQIAEIVQQPGKVGQAGFGALGARHGAGQALDHGSGVNGLLPVGGGLLWLVLGQGEGLAQSQAEGQVDYQIEAEYANDGILYRTNSAGCGVVGRSCPADYLSGQCRIGLDHAGDVVDRGIRVDAQLDDALGGFRQWRDFDGFLEALLDAPGGEGLYRLADF